MKIKTAQPRDKADRVDKPPSPVHAGESSSNVDRLCTAPSRPSKAMLTLKAFIGPPKETVVTLRWQQTRVQVKLDPGHGLLVQVQERPGVGSWTISGMPPPHRVFEGSSCLPSLLSLPGGLSYTKRFRWTAAQLEKLPDSFEFEARCREPEPTMRVLLSIQRTSPSLPREGGC